MKEDIQVSPTSLMSWSQYPYWAHSSTFHFHQQMTVTTTISKSSTEYYDHRWIWKRTFRWVQPTQSQGPSILIELTVSIGFITVGVNLKTTILTRWVWVLFLSMIQFYCSLFVIWQWEYSMQWMWPSEKCSGWVPDCQYKICRSYGTTMLCNIQMMLWVMEW